MPYLRIEIFLINGTSGIQSLRKREKLVMMDLSISIVTWNTKDLLEQCLCSIYDTAGEVNFEIFVVDNNSFDGSPKMVVEKFPQVNLIQNRDNLGYAKANNQAIRRSKGRYILILNSDTVVLPNAIEVMVNFMDEHRKTGAIGCKLLNPDNSLQPSYNKRFHNLTDAFLNNIFFVFTIKMMILNNRIFRKYLIQHFYKGYNVEQEIAWSGGSCLMVRQETIEEAGLMDEHFFMYSEEQDWCYRTKAAGWKIYYIPYAQVIHYGSQSSQQCSDRIFVEIYRSQLFFYKKHYGDKSLKILKWIIVIGLVIRTVIQSAIYLLMKSKRKEIRGRLRAHKKVYELVRE